MCSAPSGLTDVGQAEVGNALHILQVQAEVGSVLLVLRVQVEAMGWVLTAAASQTFKIIPLPGGGILWVLIAAASQNFQKNMPLRVVPTGGIPIG